MEVAARAELERENDIKAETIGQYGIRNMKQ